MSLVDGTFDLILVYKASDLIKKYIEGSEVKLKEVSKGVDSNFIYCR